ncbi:fumarylacetoacetate hydrolase family protein [Amycolatopsis pigmentata]|uniref:Fumarylacetoacetate hydrolase family protein n=1 Tax=Amycolatopsis pigmentata TaxID=450801 RepID=A0ABW5FIT5_9PSEU
MSVHRVVSVEREVTNLPLARAFFREFGLAEGEPGRFSTQLGQELLVPTAADGRSPSHDHQPSRGRAVAGRHYFTGTPSGIGASQTPPRFLQPGDHVADSIEGIGSLDRRIVGPICDGPRPARQTIATASMQM